MSSAAVATIVAEEERKIEKLSMSEYQSFMESQAQTEEEKTSQTQAAINFARLYMSATTLEQNAEKLRGKAVFGLVGYICGNKEIEAAIEFAYALPEKARKKALDLVSVLLGWNNGAVEKNGVLMITRKKEPLFKIKKGIITITEFALGHASPRVRQAAYEELCTNRVERRGLDTIKIVNETKDTTADTHIDAIKKIIQKAIKDRPNWINDPKAVKLARIIEQLDENFTEFEDPVLSSEDRRIISATANVNGSPKA